MEVKCTKVECLNNKGKCKANAVFYDGRCRTYVNAHSSMKNKSCVLVRKRGRLKLKQGDIMK